MTRLDPRIACANVHECKLWAAAHDLLAHPLLVLTWYSRPAIRFHDWTSQRAWPRGEMAGLEKFAELQHQEHGRIRVEEVTPCARYDADAFDVFGEGTGHLVWLGISARDLESAMVEVVRQLDMREATR